MIVTLAVVLVGLSANVNAQLSGFYNANEAVALAQKASDILASSKSLKDIYNALGYFKSSGSKNFSVKCNNVQDLLTKATTAYDIYYGLSIGNGGNCNFKPSAEHTTLAHKSVQVCVVFAKTSSSPLVSYNCFFPHKSVGL